MPGMSQSERDEKVRAFLRSTPNVPFDSKTIKAATGVSKSLIDFERSLSSDAAFRRETRPDPTTGRPRVYWTFVGQAQAREIREPEHLVFSRWCRWADRQELMYDAAELRAGLYLLARFEDPKQCGQNPSEAELPSEIFYVGMSKNLNNRPLGGHEGGKRRYRDLFRNDSGLEHLYVSVCPVYPVGCANRGQWYSLLQYCEMRVAWRYTERHGKVLHHKKRRTASV